MRYPVQGCAVGKAPPPLPELFPQTFHFHFHKKTRSNNTAMLGAGAPCL